MHKGLKTLVNPKEKSAQELQQPEGAAAAAASEQAVPPQKDLPKEIWELIGERMPNAQDILHASQASKFFKEAFASPLEEKELLDAIFMGKPESAVRILRAHPYMLFKQGMYKMPLYNRAEDGTLSLSEDSEQIYHASPLELLLYTGDFKMWDEIFPLILANPNLSDQDKQKIYATVKQLKRGGPDLVKIDFEPREAIKHPPYWDSLKHFNAGDDEQDNRCIYNLLSNPNGIICYNNRQENLYFYADSDTQTLEQAQRCS